MEETRQTNYTISESFELPSRGLIYSEKVNAHVELRSMTARDEMKRLSPSSSQFKTLADIIENCMIEKPKVHVYDMALGDYEFLLHKLRVVTYGDEYKVALTCPYCGEEFEAIAHLDDLEVKDFDINKFNEKRTIKLPRSGAVITLKFQTPRIFDEMEARAKELKRKFKDSDISFEILVLLASIIDTVDGVTLEPSKLDSFINKLPAMDMTKIVNAADELNAMIGLNNEFIVTCKSCGGEVRTSFRFGQEFFRPTTI